MDQVHRSSAKSTASCSESHFAGKCTSSLRVKVHHLWMSNVLKMELQESIKVLHRKGWSHRRIASELGVNRRTVKRYCCDSKCTNPQPGLGPKVHQPANRAGTHGPLSACEPHRGQIAQWYESGLSIKRIHSDLNALGFEGSYHSVYRF